MMRLRLLRERMGVLLMRRILTLVAARHCVVSMRERWRALELRGLRMRVELMLRVYSRQQMLLMLVLEALVRAATAVRAL